MSVQLIVYPQSYEGEYNTISTSFPEIFVDGINFNLVNSSLITQFTPSATLVQDVIDNLTPAMITNTWYRYSDTSGTSYPSMLNSQLQIVLGGPEQRGIIQKMTGLAVGAFYTVSMNLNPGIKELPTFYLFEGTTLKESHSFGAIGTASIANFPFIPSTPNATILIDLKSTTSGVSVALINAISVTTTAITPTGIQTVLSDGQVICDLYEDEDIPLSLSVDNFKNVAEKVQSYSKAFNLPATKRNNLIFDNMFDITRSNDGIIFNPYNKTECVLKQDGFILFKGYLKMLDITDKNGEISYNVNLYSEVVALADVLKDRTFSEIDLSELQHAYDKSNIKYSWNDSPDTSIVYDNPDTSGYRDAYTTLRYPFVDWNHQVLVADGTGTSAVDGYPELEDLGQVFRPFIQLKYLINRIFAATPFTWESSFFDSTDFEKLYMDFNWGSGNTPVEIDEVTTQSAYSPAVNTIVNYATTTYSVLELSDVIPFLGYTTPANYNDTTDIITSTVVNETWQFNYEYGLQNEDTVPRVVECRYLYNNTEIAYSIQTIPANSYASYIGTTPPIVMYNIGDTIKAQFRTDAGTANKVRQADCGILGGGMCFYTGQVIMTNSATSTTSGTLLQSLRGELEQWEFLKGIMTMFNLVSLPDEDNPNNIKFETYADVFHTDTSSGDTSDLTLASRSIQHDWTDKIDVAEMKLTPLTDLNKNTIFKFVEDDDDFCFTEYKRQVGGHLYGSQLYDASIASNGLATVLQGTKEIIAEPFAATIVKPLMEQYPQLITPAIYASSDNETEGFENSPRILYNNGIKDSAITYYIPAQSGLNSENQENYLQFSHLTHIPTVVTDPSTSTDTDDFHFGECQLVNGLGNSTPRNLYNLYWSPYYNELYNPDTRIMTIKVNLNAADINRFKFNDTVMIKNREFRVNKIDYKPNDLATVEFILIP